MSKFPFSIFKIKQQIVGLLEQFKKLSFKEKLAEIKNIIWIIVGLAITPILLIMLCTIAFDGIKKLTTKNEEIAKISDYVSCKEFDYSYIKTNYRTIGDYYFYTCSVGEKEFYVKEKIAKSENTKNNSITYIKISKEEYQNSFKIIDSINSFSGSSFSGSSSGLIGGDSNANEILRKFSDAFEPILAKNELKQKTTIEKFDTKNRKIDLTQNPKPWSLVRAEFVPTSMFENYSVNKLVDANLNEVLPSFNDFNLENYNSLKPIFVESAKTLYFPYRYGRIAVLNMETGELKWDTFDFEIAQMSLFGGKYYLNEYKEICRPEEYSQTLTCNLWEIDRSNLKDRKVALDNVKTNEIVTFADEKNVWLKTIYKQKYNSYGQSSSESEFKQNSFRNNEIEKFAKYKLKSGIVSSPTVSVTFEQTTDLVGVNFSTAEPRVDRNDETVKNCPKSDRQNPCWSEIEKLVNKYRQSLEFKDEELENFYSNLKENKPKNPETKCGDFTISGENGKIWKYKNGLITDSKPFENLKTGSLQCFK